MDFPKLEERSWTHPFFYAPWIKIRLESVSINTTPFEIFHAWFPICLKCPWSSRLIKVLRPIVYAPSRFNDENITSLINGQPCTFLITWTQTWMIFHSRIVYDLRDMWWALGIIGSINDGLEGACWNRDKHDKNFILLKCLPWLFQLEIKSWERTIECENLN